MAQYPHSTAAVTAAPGRTGQIVAEVLGKLCDCIRWMAW
ncbi:MAG: hypothetical protein KatS3mg110_2542 [Pirellulaceae bacterium]|nr:MAG: hypothetical protein KatS3mg110_2542 [Pirellulaceae bacterium]